MSLTTKRHRSPWRKTMPGATARSIDRVWMARQLSLAQLPKRGRPPRHQYVNRLAVSQSSQRGTSRRDQPPLLCTGSRHSAISQYTARRFLWYKMMAKPIITEFSELVPVLPFPPWNMTFLSCGGSQNWLQLLRETWRCCHAEVHRTSGSLRVFKQFGWVEAGSVKVALSRPAHARL